MKFSFLGDYVSVADKNIMPDLRGYLDLALEIQPNLSGPVVQQDFPWPTASENGPVVVTVSVDFFHFPTDIHLGPQPQIAQARESLQGAPPLRTSAAATIEVSRRNLRPALMAETTSMLLLALPALRAHLGAHCNRSCFKAAEAALRLIPRIPAK